MQRILIIDDDEELCDLVAEYVRAEGFEADATGDGEAGLAALRRGGYDMVLLDVMLPGANGFEILRRLRSESDLPVLMLTARGDDVDRIVGLEIGADDYVTKPFSPRELTLRVQAILRRGRAGPHALLEHGGLSLDTERHRCRVGDAPVDLTAKEFRLLTTLMGRPGRVMSRQALLEEVWGRDITVTERTVDTHLKRLREKLGPAGDLIETVRGVGYRFAE